MEKPFLRFEGKAAVYQRYRPNYPAACLERLRQACGRNGSPDGRLYEPLPAVHGVPAHSLPGPRREAPLCGKPHAFRIADVGAGTGILTRQLLEQGFAVAAVEPGADMRGVLVRELGAQPRLTVYDGCDAATGLPDGWADGVTAAQAFHWFDPSAFRRECLRILRPGGFAALIWNCRAADHPLTLAAAEVCRAHCPSFTGFSGGSRRREESIREFFGGEFEKNVYDHPLEMDEAAFVGRYLSASYAPREGDRSYAPYVRDLTGLFHAFAREGRLLFPNRTCCYLGRPGFES